MNIFTLSTYTLTVVPPGATKIASFAHYRPGWHYGGGVAPNSEMIDRALSFHTALMKAGFLSIDAFPGAEGEILLVAYHGHHYLEVSLEISSTVNIIYEIGNRVVYEPPLMSDDDAHATISKIAGRIWSTSGSFISNITITQGSGSPDWHSRTRLATEEHQLLRSNVYVTGKPQSVAMSGNFILTQRGTQLFFSNSTTGPFQPVGGSNQSYPLQAMPVIATSSALQMENYGT